MLVRIETDESTTTEMLLGKILGVIRHGQRASFLCDSGAGPAVMQRVRVKLSRVRAEMERKQKPIARFNMRSTIHPETHGGKRHDCVVVWMDRNESHAMTETLEDMLGRA